MEAKLVTKSRKRKTIDPCEKCGLHRARCLCSEIPSLQLQTRLTLIVHAKELKRTTNTGRLAIAALRNSEMIVRGAGEENSMGVKASARIDLSAALIEGYRPLLFFPSDDAVELNSNFVASFAADPRSFQLLVPDGNWRQAGKVHSRHPEIAHVPRVKIATPNLAALHLRAEHLSAGMSTLEAIARAIGILESPEAETLLLTLYQEKLRRTLSGRGVDPLKARE